MGYPVTGSTDGISREVPWKSLSKYVGPHAPEVFVELQDHNNPVRYRNIWIRLLGEPDSAGQQLDSPPAAVEPQTNAPGTGPLQQRKTAHP